MTARPPMAGRPLVLLTVAVLAAHLLLLGRAARWQPAQPAGMGTLVTRMVPITQPPPQAPAGVTPPLPQATGTTPTARIERPRPAAAPPAAPEPEPEPVAPNAPAVPPVPAEPPPEAVAAVPVPAASAAAGAAAETGVATAPGADPTPAAAVTAFAIPGSVRLRYAVSGQSRGQTWNVNGELLWRHDGRTYEAQLGYSAPLLPSRSQRSTGRITAEGLAPFRFSDLGRGEQATHFERDTRTLIFSNNAPEQPLLPGMQDRLSVFLQLAAMLAAEPDKFPAGSSIAVPTAGTRDAEPWLFTIEGDETLALPGGSVPTRKLVRNPRREYDVRVELWLGTGMDYVPVRIRLTQPNGDSVDQQWTSTDSP